MRLLAADNQAAHRLAHAFADSECIEGEREREKKKKNAVAPFTCGSDPRGRELICIHIHTAAYVAGYNGQVRYIDSYTNHTQRAHVSIFWVQHR